MVASYAPNPYYDPCPRIIYYPTYINNIHIKYIIVVNDETRTILLDFDPSDIDLFVCLLVTLITAEFLHELNRSVYFDLQLSLMTEMPIESLITGMFIGSLVTRISTGLLL